MGVGSDFAGVDDIDSEWSYLEGEANEKIALTQALARRLSTPRGGLPGYPNECYDIRAFIGDTITPGEAEDIIEAECLKEERVTRVSCSITASGEVWTISINGVAGEEPFSLTLSVSSVTVELLNKGA